MSFHRASATSGMTCSDGVLRVRVKAIKTQPSVKLALVVHEVKTILLSNVTQSPKAAAVLCVKHVGRSQRRSVTRGHQVHHCHTLNLFLTDTTLFHLINADT